MKKFIPTKYQIARMQTAFILDDVEYVEEQLKTIKKLESYILYFYRRYDKSIWYYIFKKASYNVLNYLLTLEYSVNIYANISVNTNFPKLITTVNKLDTTQCKLLYIDSYESFVRYITTTLCYTNQFDILIDLMNVVDTQRFDIYTHLQELRYIYTHDEKASTFIREMKFKEISNII